MTDNDWSLRDRAIEYETGWYTGGYDLVEQPDGTAKRYYWADLPPAVVIIPIIDDDIIVVSQYRPAVRERHIELPAGIVESGESYTQAAQRELKEETNFAAAGLSLIQELSVATGVLRHQRAYVFAEGLEPVQVANDSNEFLTVSHLPIDEAIETARAPPANDSTITGLLLAREEGLL